MFSELSQELLADAQVYKKQNQNNTQKIIQSKSSCVSITSSAELYESGGQAVTSCTASGLGISAHVH